MNPITPIMMKPMPTACEILINSLLSAIVYKKISAYSEIITALQEAYAWCIG